MKNVYNRSCDEGFLKDILDNLSENKVDYCFFEGQIQNIEALCMAREINFVYQPILDEHKEVFCYRIMPLKPRHNKKYTSIHLSYEEFKAQQEKIEKNWELCVEKKKKPKKKSKTVAVKPIEKATTQHLFTVEQEEYYKKLEETLRREGKIK